MKLGRTGSQHLPGPDQDRFKLGLAGLNNQGRDHLRAAAHCSHAAIVAVCDNEPEVLREVLEHNPDLRGYEHLDSLLHDPEIEGLVLALPHHVYAEHWEAITRRGLPILKEKPLGRNLAEAMTFIDQARQHRCFLQTAIQRRAQPSYQHLKACLAGQEVFTLSAVLHLGLPPQSRASGWRGQYETAGGGALLDMGYHLVDLAHFLVGALQLVNANVWAGDAPGSAELLDTEAAITGRAGKTWVRLECQRGGTPEPGSKTGYRKLEEVLVDATAGRYRADREGVWLEGQQVFRCEQDWQPAMAAQLDAFVGRVQQGHVDAQVIWDQLPAMRIIEQAYASARLLNPLYARLNDG